MQHDLMAQVLIFLGQYVIDNADTLSGKAVGVAPVVMVAVSGWIRGAWLKDALMKVTGQHRTIESAGRAVDAAHDAIADAMKGVNKKAP